MISFNVTVLELEIFSVCRKKIFEVCTEFVTTLLLFFMFWFFGCKACGIPALWPGIEPAPHSLEGEVPTTGPPGKSLEKLNSRNSIYLRPYDFTWWTPIIQLWEWRRWGLRLWTPAPHYLRVHFHSTNHYVSDLRQLHNPSVPHFPQLENKQVCLS